jgi:hypothetical protein
VVWRGVLPLYLQLIKSQTEIQILTLRHSIYWLIYLQTLIILCVIYSIPLLARLQSHNPET